ncbi:MAG: SPOCS domain-containing protein [Sarcina sp.]
MLNPLQVVKSSNLDEVIVGDVIEYSIKITNSTGSVLNKVIVKDLLSPDLDFIDGSIKINQMSINGDILAGIDIGPMALNKVIDVVFKAKVISKSGATIDNKSTVVYTYIEGIVEKTDDVVSNTVSISVEIAELKIEKVATTANVELNDIIDYRIILTNVGTIELLNIIVTDELSPAVELVEGSVKVNGVPVNANAEELENGLNVGSIAVGEDLFVDYKVKVIAGTCSGYIENEACAKYNYQMKNQGTGTKTTECVSVSTCVSISAFKQLGLSKSITLPLAKPNIEEIDDVVVEVIIDNTYVVKTLKSNSNEGQDLSGFKLIVHGRLKMSIEYTALLSTQPMHSAHCEVPFSSFIILPPDYVEGSYVEVLAEIESTDVDLIDLRSAMVNIMFLIIAKIN